MSAYAKNSCELLFCLDAVSRLATVAEDVLSDFFAQIVCGSVCCGFDNVPPRTTIPYYAGGALAYGTCYAGSRMFARSSNFGALK